MQRTYLTAAVLVAGLVGWPSGAHAQDAPLVFRVPVTGTVDMGLAPFIERAIREAEGAGVSVVVLDIDTPGGRVDSAERIADAISDSGVPVYAFVNRRAFSAGDRSSNTRHIHAAWVGRRRGNTGRWCRYEGSREDRLRDAK